MKKCTVIPLCCRVTNLIREMQLCNITVLYSCFQLNAEKHKMQNTLWATARKDPRCTPSEVDYRAISLELATTPLPREPATALSYTTTCFMYVCNY